jgi:multiple antibiotic resistance protein
VENIIQNLGEISRGIGIMFIAIDPIGLTAIFLLFTEDESLEKKRLIALKSSLAALVVGIAFLFTGESIFGVIGIQMSDFKIGGGLLLVVLSVYDIISPGQRKKPDTESAIVPLGVPLISGPAVLTALIFLYDNYGYLTSIISFSLNILLVFLSFYFSKFLLKIFGSEGLRGFAKLISILLSAYGVMMIRNGVFEILKMSG